MRPKLWTTLAAFLLAAPLHAQRTTGGIAGTLKDATGGALPGVTVEVRGANIVGSETADDPSAALLLAAAPVSQSLTPTGARLTLHLTPPLLRGGVKRMDVKSARPRWPARARPSAFWNPVR